MMGQPDLNPFIFWATGQIIIGKVKVIRTRKKLLRYDTQFSIELGKPKIFRLAIFLAQKIKMAQGLNNSSPTQPYYY